ncbi:MAG TPA: hypothetical protein VMP42_04260, partial [Actinomycetota bacterium]|nr:hypothetical protein [Actinomycetota bacterium]
MSHPVKIAASTLAAIALLFAGLSVAQANHEHGFFNIIVKANIDDDPAPKLQDPRLVAEFNYVRELDTPTLDAPAGWIDGDRRGYHCAYAFLTYRGWIVGRATYAYIDPPGDGNTPVVND